MTFSFIDIPKRLAKPRGRGITMVIDKYFGVRATQDFVDIVGQYTDIVKFGWGTSRIIDEDILTKKIQLLQDANILVCPGGTFLEIAYDQDRVMEFLKSAKTLGFSAIEVSNGIHPHMTLSDKHKIIDEANNLGFYVVSEIGRKMPAEDNQLSVRDRIFEAKADLKAGAQKVIMEARESGTVGIFDDKGNVNSLMAYEIFQELDSHDIIWEAPRKSQQVWLVQNLGSDVNIGNVAPKEVLSLETLRNGLRGDTMRDHRRDALIVYLELGVGGALRARSRGDIVVVVDALRASTTIMEAFQQGIRCIIPTASATELVGEVTAGERGGQKLLNADCSNSPLELSQANLKGKQLVHSSTNGTECILSAKGSDNIVLIGSVTNCSAVSQVALQLVKTTGKNLTILAAGRNNLPAIEDRIGITEILKELESPIVRGVVEPYYSNNIEQDFINSESGRNLISLGYGEDVIICSQLDRYDCVPVFDGINISLEIKI